MLATPQIIMTNAQHAAVIRLTIPRGEMMTTFGSAVGELMAVLAAKGSEYHLMHGRGRDAEEPHHVGICWWAPVRQCVDIDEREILALFGCERGSRIITGSIHRCPRK